MFVSLAIRLFGARVETREKNGVWLCLGRVRIVATLQPGTRLEYIWPQTYEKEKKKQSSRRTNQLLSELAPCTTSLGKLIYGGQPLEDKRS